MLYAIDPFDFQVALDTDEAELRQKAADLQVKRLQAERRRHLSDLATTPEEQQLYVGNATQAQAAFDAAQRRVAQVEINLKRTQVRSPVNGHVTNLLMRAGESLVNVRSESKEIGIGRRLVTPPSQLCPLKLRLWTKVIARFLINSTTPL